MSEPYDQTCVVCGKTFHGTPPAVCAECWRCPICGDRHGFDMHTDGSATCHECQIDFHKDGLEAAFGKDWPAIAKKGRELLDDARSQ